MRKFILIPFKAYMQAKQHSEETNRQPGQPIPAPHIDLPEPSSVANDSALQEHSIREENSFEEADNPIQVNSLSPVKEATDKELQTGDVNKEINSTTENTNTSGPVGSCIETSQRIQPNTTGVKRRQSTREKYDNKRLSKKEWIIN